MSREGSYKHSYPLEQEHLEPSLRSGHEILAVNYYEVDGPYEVVGISKHQMELDKALYEFWLDI